MYYTTYDKSTFYPKFTFNQLLKIAGSLKGAMLLKHLEYWAQKTKGRFYKFTEPCSHPLYRQGDSWCEEIGVSRRLFNKLFDSIGHRYRSKSEYLNTQDPFKGKLYVAYYDRKRNQTFYIKNPQHDQVLWQPGQSSPPSTQSKKFPAPKRKDERGRKNNYKNERVGEPLGKNDELDIRKVPVKYSKDIQYISRMASEELSRNGNSAQSFIYKDNITKQKTINLIEKTLWNSLSYSLEREMIKIWNEEVGNGKVQALPFRLKKLSKALNLYFQGDIQKWRRYCFSIASSRFLMGKVTSFKASIDWAIGDIVIQKIKEGDYGIEACYEEPALSHHPLNQVEGHICQLEGESELIKTLRFSLIQGLGQATYGSWFANEVIYSESPKEIIILSTSRFRHDYVKRHFGRFLELLGERLGVSVILQLRDDRTRNLEEKTFVSYLPIPTSSLECR